MSETTQGRNDLFPGQGLDACGKKALEILALMDERSALQDQKKALDDKIKAERHTLAELLEAAGRERIKVEDVLFEVKIEPEEHTVTLKRDPHTKKTTDDDMGDEYEEQTQEHEETVTA